MLFSNVKYFRFSSPGGTDILVCLFTVLVSGVTSILLNKDIRYKGTPNCMIHVHNIQKMGKTDSTVLAFRIVTSLGKETRRSEWGGRWHTGGLLGNVLLLGGGYMDLFTLR